MGLPCPAFDLSDMSARVFQDQLGRKLSLEHIPQRIVSVVPSQTELLFDLDLEHKIIGRTKFCIHPAAKVQKCQVVGGTKNLHLDRIRALQPDLIVANKEENNQSQIEALAKEFRVWISDIQSLSDAKDMIYQLAELTDRLAAGEAILKEIRKKSGKWQQTRDSLPVLRVAYLIWQQPLMVAAGDTFIHHLLEVAGFKNVFENLKRYPEVSIHDLSVQSPDFIFLSSEPYPFREKHLNFFRKEFPQSKVILVNGECFSWYGSRLLYSFDYFAGLRKAIDFS